MTSTSEHSEDGARKGNSGEERATDPGLPDSLRLVLDPGTQLLPGNNTEHVALGGSPLRLMKLSTPAASVVLDLVAGKSVGEVAESLNRSTRSVARLARRLLDAGMAHPRWVETSVDLKSVTIVIPVFQREQALQRLLTSFGELLSQVAEVVVVDDGSPDASGEVARSFGARVVRHDAPRGPAAARNAGLDSVATPFVAFIDSDCVVDHDWLTPLLQHFADPLVVVVAPRIGAISASTLSETSGSSVSSGSSGSESAPKGRSHVEDILRAYEEVNSSLDLGAAEARVSPRTRVAYVPSAALVGRTPALQSVGGFDTTMHVGEDVDLIWRLTELGHGARYDPSAVVMHDHRTSLVPFVRRRFDYGSSAARLAKRHPGQVPPVAVSSWSGAAWALVATCSPVGIAAGFAVAAGSTAALPRKLSALAHPTRESLKLATRGHLGAGRQLASAIWRSYLPVAVVAAIFSRRARRVLLVSAIVPNVQQWRERRPRLDPIQYVGIRLLDDASYCVGVWRGCLDEKTIGPLVPDLTSWPGRRGTRTNAVDTIGSDRKTDEG